MIALRLACAVLLAVGIIAAALLTAKGIVGIYGAMQP